jgi:hypothetical protein
MKSVKGMGPGEGARRPGGEAAADGDDVEGHGVIPKPRASGDDLRGEGVMPKPRASGDDVEGHGVIPKPRASGDESDVEGHLKRREPAAGGATGLRRRDERLDPEGRKIRESGDEEDTEGHSTGPRIR